MESTTVTFAAALSQVVSTVTEALKFFTMEPTVYFTAAAFLGVAIGVGRKLIPMRKR